MTTVQATSAAASNDAPRQAGARGETASGASNKPMVPTAPDSPAANPLHPMRRHIGQPLSRPETFAMDIMPASVVLDWYLGFLHHMLYLSGGWPMWRDIQITEDMEYGDDGVPKRLGTLKSVPDYRARFTDLATRGWSHINLHAVGMLDGVLILHFELPTVPPRGSKWTSINMSGATKAVEARGFKLDDFVGGGITCR